MSSFHEKLYSIISKSGVPEKYVKVFHWYGNNYVVHIMWRKFWSEERREMVADKKEEANAEKLKRDLEAFAKFTDTEFYDDRLSYKYQVYITDKSAEIKKNPFYDDRELMAFRRQMEETEKLPLAERKANAVEWFNDLLNDHMMVAQRVGWLLNGSYGKGSFDSACRVINSPRMNQVAWCAITIANLEWRCPAKFAIQAWKKLPVEKRYLVNEAIRQEIADAKREGYCG